MRKALPLLVFLFFTLGCTEIAKMYNLGVEGDQQQKVEIRRDPGKQYKEIEADSGPSRYVSSIHSLGLYEEGDQLRAYFFLRDQYGQEISSSGTVRMRIYDMGGKKVYESLFNITEENFTKKEFGYEGSEGYRLGFEWLIPKSEINKSTYSSGTAKLTFITDKDSYFYVDEYDVPLAVYSAEELEEIHYQHYLANSSFVNQSVSIGNYQIILERAGYIESESGSENFRADLSVKNIGALEHNFLTEDARLNYNGYYYPTYESSSQVIHLYSGESKNFTLLWDWAPHDMSDQIELTAGSYTTQQGAKINYNFFFSLGGN